MTRSLTILMVSPQFRPMIGGYERAAERLSAELVRQGHDVTVIAERRDRRWPRMETLEGVKVQRLGCIYRPGLHMLTSLVSFTLYIVLYGSRYDILHVHQYGNHAGIVVALGRLLGKPVVLKITSTSREGILSAQTSRTWRARLVAALLRKVDLCIATTKPAAGEASRFGIPDKRIALVPNGIDTATYGPIGIEEKSRLRGTHRVSGAPVALYLGRLSHAKNPEGLIDAWALVHTVIPGAQLIVVGDGPLRGLVESRIQHYGLSHVVTLVGEQEDVRPWYGLADLFVLPSRYEGLSNSLIEAMSCGLPVVSTRVSGSTEILEECDVGKLVDIGDTPALADAIARMLGDSDRSRACGKRSRDYAERQLAVNRIAEKTVHWYRQLLGGTAEGAKCAK